MRGINTERRTGGTFGAWGKGSLKLSLSGGAPSERVPSFNTVQTHVYTTANLGYWWRTATFQTNSQGFASAARRQQLKHRNCRSSSFEHPLPPLALSLLALGKVSRDEERLINRPAYRYSHYGELHDSNGARYKEEFKSTWRVESRASRLIRKRKKRDLFFCCFQRGKHFKSLHAQVCVINI